MKKQKTYYYYIQLIQVHKTLAQVEVQTNTEVVKNDDEVIDGQNETNEKLGFLGKTFQKIRVFCLKTREKKELDQKQEKIFFNKIGGFLKENKQNFRTFFSDLN